jgi:hypothetical protein
MKDKHGNIINLRDILISDDGYSVIVMEYPSTHEWYGKLICDPGYSCANIPYALNNGHGYTKKIEEYK